MNAQEITILIEYWKARGNVEKTNYYEQRLEDYQQKQNRD